MQVERLDADGTLLWSHSFEDGLSRRQPRDLRVTQVAAGSDGSVLVAGQWGEEDVVVKYAASGMCLWDSRVPGVVFPRAPMVGLFPGGSSMGLDMLGYHNRVLAFDGRGRVVVEHRLDDMDPPMAHPTSARLVNHNQLVWASRVNRDPNGWAPVTAIVTLAHPFQVRQVRLHEEDFHATALDAQGNLYGVTAWGSITCVSPTGTNLWKTHLPQYDPNTGDYDNWSGTIELLLDEANDGLLIFVSVTNVTPGPNRAYLYRTSLSGKFQWRQLIQPAQEAEYFGGRAVPDGQGGVWVAGRRKVRFRNGDLPTRELVFLEQYATRTTGNLTTVEKVVDRVLWEDSIPSDSAFSPGPGVSLTALPHGAVAVASRLQVAKPSTVVCLKPAMSQSRAGEYGDWSFGLSATSSSGGEGPFQKAEASSRAGGYWEQSGGFFTYKGGYFPYLVAGRPVGAQSGEEEPRYVLIGSNDNGGLLAPDRVALLAGEAWSSMVRWTAPRDGIFRVSGHFHSLPSNYGHHGDGPVPPVAVRHGTNDLVVLNATGMDPVPFGFTIAVRQGETLDFRTLPTSPPESGLPATVRYIGVRAEISVPNLPPLISFRSEGGFLWSNGIPHLQFTAQVEDAHADRSTVRFQVDGRVVAEVGTPPYSALVALTPGRSEVSARVVDDGGLQGISNPLSLQVPTTPEDLLVIPAADLQAMIFQEAYWERAREMPGTSVPLSFAIMALTEALKKHPQLPEETVNAFLQFMLEPSNGSRAALHQSHRPSGPVQQPSNFETEVGAFMHRLNDGIIREFDKFPVPGSSLLAGEMRNLARIYGEHQGLSCDNPMAPGCSTDDRIFAFMDRFDVAMSDLRRFNTDLAVRAKEAMVREVQQHLQLGLNDQTATLLSGMRGMSQEFKSAIAGLQDAAGNLLTTQSELLNLTQTEFASVRREIDELQTSNQSILESQQGLVALLTDDRARAAEEQRLRSEAEARAARRQENDAAVGLLANLVGFADPRTGRQIEVVGRSLLTIKNAVEDLFSSNLTGMQAALMTGNIVGAVMNIFSLFSDPGPTPEEIILEEIGVVKQMIQELGEQMHGRFDRVDQQLERIYDTFSQRFNEVDFRLGILGEDVTSLNNLTLQLRGAVADVDRRLQRLFEAQEARKYNLLVGRLENFESAAIPMTTNDFIDLVLRFRNAATLDAVDEIASPVDRPRDDGQLAVQLTGTNDLLTASLNYLNLVVQENRWMEGSTLTPDAGTRIPAGSEWSLGADGMQRLIRRWPQLARSNPIYLQRLEDVQSAGETLRTALERITLLRSGREWRTNALWGRLIAHYRQKSAAFSAELQEWNIRTTANLVAGSDPERRLHASRMDLWGPLDQGTTYQPAFVQEPLGPLDSGTTRGGPNLAPLAHPERLFSWIPEMLLAELLGVSQSRWVYQNAGFDGDRRRSVGRRTPVAPSAPWGRIREANFVVELRLTSEPRTAGLWTQPVEWIWQYRDPQFHIHGFNDIGDGAFYRFGFNYFGYDDNEEISQAIYDFRDRYNTREFAPPNHHGWENWAHLIEDFWLGHWEPIRPDQRIASVHRLTPVRDHFSSEAMVTSWPSEADGRLFHRTLEGHLRILQTHYWQSLSAEMMHPGTDLGKAALALSGARELLRVFVELGLPQTYQESDGLRSMFTGEESLPDLGTLTQIVDHARFSATTSARHSSRPAIMEILANRLNALEILVNERLAEIQSTGTTEILPFVEDGLLELSIARDLIENPVRPLLSLPSAPSDRVEMRLWGEPHVDYLLEWSSDLREWQSVPGLLNHGGTVVWGAPTLGTGFVRVKAP